jgi:hypothetical protein
LLFHHPASLPAVFWFSFFFLLFPFISLFSLSSLVLLISLF